MLILSPPAQPPNAATYCCIKYNKSGISDLFVPKNALNLAGTRGLQVLAHLLTPGAHCMQCQLSEVAFLSVQVL